MNWQAMTSKERKSAILEYTGAEQWSWIEDAFAGMTVMEVVAKAEEDFEWQGIYGLAVAIVIELNT